MKNVENTEETTEKSQNQSEKDDSNESSEEEKWTNIGKNKTKYEYINLRIKHILFYPFFIT